jgi:methionine synthase / methylenetetrahydrofolate reductase(NADPH)
MAHAQQQWALLQRNEVESFMNVFLQRLHAQPLLADGAMGTLLYARGISIDQCLEALVVDCPETVSAIHEEYTRAGADVITTHTFGANRLRLAHFGLENKVREFNETAVRLVQEVRKATGRDFLIAGNVGPVGKHIDWDNALEGKEVVDAFNEQIAVLVEAGVDLLLFETFSDVKELEVAVQAARELSNLPVVASMSYDSDGLTLAGQSVGEVTTMLLAAGVDVIGENCSVGPAQMVETLREMRRGAPQGRLGVTPNAGLPMPGDYGMMRYPVGPQEFAGYVPAFLALGARWIGGCCGTTPEYTAAMRSVLDQG